MILNAETGEQVDDPFDVASVRCLQFVGDGRHVAVGQLLPTNMDALRLINLDTRVILSTLEANSGCESIDCLPNENILASINWRGEAAIWDLKSNRQVGSVPAHANAPGALKFSPDGRTLATCGHDGTVKLWATRKLLTRLSRPPTPLFETVTWYAFSNDNRTIVSSALSSYPKRWDVETGKLLTEYTELTATLTSAPQTAFSPDDRLLAAIDTENRVIILGFGYGQAEEAAAAKGQCSRPLSACFFVGWEKTFRWRPRKIARGSVFSANPRVESGDRRCASR